MQHMLTLLGCRAEPLKCPLQQERVSQSTEEIEVDLDATPNDLAHKWEDATPCGLPQYAVPDDA